MRGGGAARGVKQRAVCGRVCVPSIVGRGVGRSLSACCLRRWWGAADAHDSLGGCGPAKGEPCRSFEHFLRCPHAAAPLKAKLSSMPSVSTHGSAVRSRLAPIIESLAVRGRNVYLSHGWCSTTRFDRAAR